MEGFIVLHRKLLEWGWYDDTNMVRLWVHLLLMANFREKSWHGQIIKRGQFVTNREELARQTGLSVQEVRTCLDRLIECGCITKRATSKYTMITICKYGDYQDVPEKNNQQVTSKKPTQCKQKSKVQPTNNQQKTNKKSCGSNSCECEGKEDNQQITNKQPTNNQQITTTKQRNNNNISSSSYTACTCEENSKKKSSLIESALNKWKRSDIVKKGAVPDLTDVWIEEVERLVLRFNKQGITEEAVRSYYEDFKAQEVTETLETTYHEWRKHFGNFVRKSIKQQEEETKKQKEIARHGANQDYNSESARAARLEGAAQVMRELYENGKQYYREVPDH